MYVHSSEKPTEPYDVASGSSVRATRPVSSLSSRTAQAAGFSPGSSLPAGISHVRRPTAMRHCLMRHIDPLHTTQTPAPPWWRAISRRPLVPSGRATSETSTPKMRPCQGCSVAITFSTSEESDVIPEGDSQSAACWLILLDILTTSPFPFLFLILRPREVSKHNYRRNAQLQSEAYDVQSFQGQTRIA